jgi:glycerophosphoryl diester phosphodiesterase
VLERFPEVVLNLDIKQTAPVVPPYEESLARLLAEFGRGDDVMVASFLDAATDAFRRLAPAVPTSAGMTATAEFWRAVRHGGQLPDSPVAAYQVPERMGELVVVDEPFVEAAHGCGKAVHVWTINDEESMERLVGLGVDGVISDVPSVLSTVLRDRGVAWDGRLRWAPPDRTMRG